MNLGRVIHAAGVDERTIRIEDPALEMLEGIDAYSHLIIIARTDTATGSRACLARFGPRPSGLSVHVVELIGRDDELFKVSAAHLPLGAEVLDILPYEPASDAFPLAVVP